MAARKMADYLWLLNVLYNNYLNDGNGLTFKEIAAKWARETGTRDYDRSKFNRQRDSIWDIWGIEIKSHRYGQEHRYSIDNPEEIEDNPLNEWMLNSFATADMLSTYSELRDRIMLEKIPSGQKYLATVLLAIRSQKKILFHHTTFYDTGTGKTHTVSPYGVRLFNKRWYVIGLDNEGNYIKSWALDRIDRDLTILDEGYSIPEDFDLDTFYKNYFGIYVGKSSFSHIKIKATNNQPDYIRSLPLHHSQTEVRISGECSIFEYDLCPEIDFDREILGKGPDVEVLEPEWYREHIKEQIQSAIKKYEK